FERSHQTLFKFSAQDYVCSQVPQVGFIHRRIEAVEPQTSAWVEAPDARQSRDRQPRRRMHGDVEGNHVGGANGAFAELFAREVMASHFGTRAAEPRRRRRQPTRLAAKLVSCKQ